MRGAVAISCVDQNKLPLGLYIDEIHRAWPNLLSRGTKLKRDRGSLFAVKPLYLVHQTSVTIALLPQNQRQNHLETIPPPSESILAFSALVLGLFGGAILILLFAICGTIVHTKR